MTYLVLSLLAFFAGTAISVQAGINAQLGVLLKNSLLATVVAFFFSFVFVLMAYLIAARPWPTLEEIKHIPAYFWFSGGLLSAVAISCMYWLIPKMGVGPLISIALAGQLLFGVLASHFGWFQLPVVTLSMEKLLGICSLLLGIYLINFR